MPISSSPGKYLCGVDLGGTKLAAALYTQGGELAAKEMVHDHADKDGDGIVLAMANLVKTLLKGAGVTLSDLLGIGVAVAAHVNFKEGKIITTSNFAHTITDFPVVEKMSALLPGVKIVMDNDANAQGYGEYKFGAGKGYNSLVFVTVSTGIGGGIVLNGRTHRGRSGTAGEVGHSIIDLDSDIQCTCGNYGCTMALASGLFFPDLYRYFLKKGIKSTIGVTEETAGEMNGPAVKKGWEDGDPVCAAIVEQSAVAVGAQLFNIFSMLDPELVILGGGLMALGETYRQRIRDEFLSHTHKMMIGEMEIKLAETGVDACLVGAAALVLEQQEP
jgi:glucokinase